MAGALKESWWDNSHSGTQTAAPQKGGQTLDIWRINPSMIFTLKKWKFSYIQQFLPEAQNSSTNIRPKRDTTPMSFNTVNGQSVVHPPGTQFKIEREQALASQSLDELQRNQSSCTVQLHSQEILRETEPWRRKENRWWLPGLGPGAGTPGR